MATRYNPYTVVLASCVVIFWPGALAFGLPGVLASHWQEAFGVNRAAVGQTMFVLLAGVGCFMYWAGRWQERVGAHKLVAIGALVNGTSPPFWPWPGT